VITLKMYGDESADATRSSVFAVAGVLGTDDEWALAMREWLRRTRGLPFHANVCESQYAKHEDPQKHKDNLRLYGDLTQILARSYLVGFAVALDLQSQSEFFPDLLPDVSYYKCLGDVIRIAAETAHRFNERPEENEDVRIEFVFDSRRQSDGAARTLYDVMANLPNWSRTGIFDTKITFEDRQEPRLELPDLLAREAMKELARKLTKAARPMRRSRAALEETQKFKFVELDRAYCVRWRELVNNPEPHYTREDYHLWLKQTGRVQNGQAHDNTVNRLLFFSWLEHQSRNEEMVAAK
jgi:hypothetical protein